MWIALKKWVWPHDALLELADCRSVNLWFLKGNILYLFLGRQFEGIWWQSIYATPLRCVSILVRWLFFLKGIYPVSLSQSTYLFLRNWNKHLICPANLANHGIQKELPLVCFTILCGAVAGALAFLHLARGLDANSSNSTIIWRLNLLVLFWIRLFTVPYLSVRSSSFCASYH